MRAPHLPAGLALLAVGAPLAQGLAQGNVIAERRAGLRLMGQHAEAFQTTVRAGGDVRPLAARVDEMTAFYARLPSLVPTESLTPPQPQGTNDGQTRALAAIATDRAGFARAAANMGPVLAALKAAAESGDVAATGRALQTVGQTCGACHREYRAR